ncbi:hypothetical protein BJ912DRAFT_626976 [Pholiota molesta]|nr:hypothetical protein BJ912DRAFT_626976 [Pholiota molesta]
MDPANANTLIYSEDNYFLTNVSLVEYAIAEKAPMSITPAEGHHLQALTVGRQYPTSEYVASHLGASPNQLGLVPQIGVTVPNRNHRDYPQEAQQPALNTSVLLSDVEIVPTGQNPDPELQHEFLQFLMENQRLLNSVTSPTEVAIAAIQDGFANDIRNRGLAPPLLDIQKIGLQFKPVVGSAASRQQSDSRTKTQAKIIKCPFPFCEGHFTRSAGLKNHLSGHFSLTPKQCLRCGKCFSDAAIKRHKDSCTRGLVLTQTSRF